MRSHRRPPAPVLRSLNARVGAVYATLVPDGPDVIPSDVRRFLRREYLREPADLRRVRRYATAQARGIRLTIAAAGHHPEAKRLLGPEVLLLLERLAHDPLGLREAWPADAPLQPLLALAEANGRPYAG